LVDCCEGKGEKKLVTDIALSHVERKRGCSTSEQDAGLWWIGEEKKSRKKKEKDKKKGGNREEHE